MEQTVLLHEMDAHYEITFNRPEKLNAFSPQLMKELHQTFKDVTKKPHKIIVLKGSGTSFSSGFDIETTISTTDSNTLFEQLQLMQGITSLIVHYPAPVIAAIHGYALGAACEIALNCDLIYAADNAIFGFPELEVGLSITQGASYFLPRMAGLHKAKELIFFSKRFEAKEAYELGLVNQVIENSQLFDFVSEKINELSEVNLQALGNIKKLFHYSTEHTLAESMEREVKTIITLLRSLKEGQ